MRVMNGRAKSLDELESFDGNWVITNSRSQQLYDIPRKNNQTRIPSGNTLTAKSQGYHSERWAGSTAISKDVRESYLRRDGKLGRSDYATRRLKSNNHRNHSVDRPSTSTTNSSGYISSRENFRKPLPREVVLHRSDGEFGFTMRQIPSTTYGRKSTSAFRPTSRVPALQRLNCIDAGSLADRVGLKPGDYIIEVNNQCVTCSPHQYVVHLIKSSPDALKLKVVEGTEDALRIHYHTTLPQRNNAARRETNGDKHSNSFIPRNHNQKTSYNRPSNGIHLQQLKLDVNGNHLPSTTALAPHQTSNGLSPTMKRSPPVSRPAEPEYTNIRLSRAPDHDQIYYESSRKQKALNASSQPRTARSGLQRIPSYTSLVTHKSEPQALGSNPRSFTGGMSPRSHQTVSTGSMQENGKEDVVTWSGSSTDDLNHTYDKIRPADVPFDTDEGYIRLSGNVDYVAQVENEKDQVDFLAMAEKARQMYLRTKSISQTQ